jgi:hypothetical protein
MKAKQLRRIIREAIEEILTEGNTYAGKDAVDDMKKDPKYGTLSGTAKQDTENKLKRGESVTIGEGDLEEMARLAKGFKLANPNLDASQYANERISGTSMEDIINFFRENPGAEKSTLQSQFNFVRPQIANAVVNGLLDAGVLVKLSASGEEEAPTAPGETAPVQASEPEDLFIGSAENPLSMYFDNEPNEDGSEDFNDEEEPTPGELEPIGKPMSTGGMSDEDFEIWDKYDTLKTRLNGIKSNLNKIKRSKGKGGVAGDISDTSGNEVSRLRDLKKSLEDKINALVAGSEYLQKKVEKETGKAYEPIEVEPKEEDKTINESFNTEYEKRKLQFYAGIIK